MKKKILLLSCGIAFALGNLEAQANIPAVVTNAFKAKFPDVQNVEWKAANNNFEADFTVNGLQETASFTSNGILLETDKKMSLDSVPAIVKDGLKRSIYANWTIGEVTYIDNSKTTFYKIYVVNNSTAEKKFLYFNSQGILIMAKAVL
ncbi:MAG TPA: PepSY-like domain-containing protein [Parafilimonas sp.]|nr:PepSY-like domain-containing protein [Parafilimonas sp.]